MNTNRHLATDRTRARRARRVHATLATSLLAIAFCAAAVAAPQPAILTTILEHGAVVFPDPENAPKTQKPISGLPANADPQALAPIDSDHALLGDTNNSRIFVVEASTAKVLHTIDTAPAGYPGTGTIAVSPNGAVALASGNSSQVAIIQAPFNASSKITPVPLPSFIQNFQTQAIVFDKQGRAFVYHRAGISVLNPPYTSVAFTMPVQQNIGGAIAITPDGNTLLTTDFQTGIVVIFHAPFSASSTGISKNVAGLFSSFLDGLMVTPDGSKAIIASKGARRVVTLSAPFSENSAVEVLPLPPDGGSGGFEDVGISPDGRVAIATGGSSEPEDVAVLIKAPFTAAGATSALVPIENTDNPTRGGGAVRFLPPAPVPAKLLNISTRVRVESGDDVLIGGFIVTGSAPKKVLLRALGPSLPVNGKLADPTLELVRPNAPSVFNDNWQDSPESDEINQTLPPSHPNESAIIATLQPGSYTAIVRGRNGGTGVGLVEAYDLDEAAASTLANISTRGLVQTGDNVMIGGFIIGGNTAANILVRAIGPSLADQGVSGALQDPTLELVDKNGTKISNDNWRSTQEKEIKDTGVPPPHNRESAILATLQPDPYTAIVRGKGGTTGVALVEVYNIR